MNSLKTLFLSAVSSGVLLSASVMPATASAAAVAPIQLAIAEFLDVQNKGLPGQASYSIGAINTSGLPDDCRNLNVTMDANARPWGKTHVNVRCTEGSTWSLYVPVDIHVLVNYVVSARPLTAGQIISTTDIRQSQGDLADLPQGILTDLAQAIGQLSRISLPADRPLRADMLRQPLVVKQGQNVKVVSEGASFQVSSDGRALNNAAAGQVVQVRLASGQVLSGIAQKDGTVAIAY
ncbi:MAG: flagellar basal body P-ring formation protein FlgA [Rugosibacter sp.]|nr:MAG: flagellar basal body P-ring formation protein FlgA [Rugosibacter sp.]TBR09587.1 MAG: flagellar basal body P-ring formation protein FlgA [Rugosibacter sp.]